MEWAADPVLCKVSDHLYGVAGWDFGLTATGIINVHNTKMTEPIHDSYKPQASKGPPSE